MTKYRLFLFGLMLFFGLLALNLNGFAQSLPIKSVRTILFDTQETTYMDVDLSPDGKTIIFDILGDIYELPVSGGIAKQLTHGLACNSRPIWSPDGKHIAFISDQSGTRHLAVMNIDGTNTRTLGLNEQQIAGFGNLIGISQSLAPYWMPNGEYIAFGKDFYQLREGKFTLPINVNGQDIQFSPDGKTVYFRDRKGMEKQQLDSGVASLLASLPENCVNARLSPDRHSLTYITYTHTKSELWVRDLLNSVDRQIASCIETHRMFTEHYTFTRDSKQILIGFGGKLHQINLTTGTDQIIPFIAKVKVDMGKLDYHTFQVTHDSIHVAYTRSANASPDGKHLVFSALDRLYTLSLPDGKPKILAKQDAEQFQPVYSPDGKWIAYVSWNDVKGGFVWRVPSTGGAPQKITDLPGYYQHPEWSPDCSMLAVIKQDPKKLDNSNMPWPAQLLIVPVNGGQSNMVVDSIPGDNILSFTPDNKSVIFMQNRQTDLHKRLVGRLYSVRLDGSGLRVLAVTNMQSIDAEIEQISLSPNGRYLIYKLPNDDLYLVTTIGLDLPTPIIDYQQKVSAIRFARGGTDPHWEKGGDVISWSFGNRFYRIAAEKIINEARNGTLPIPDEVFNISLTAPASYARGSIALYNARIIIMHEDEVIEHGTIVITNGRFIEVGTNSKVKIPKKTKIYDLTGKTIMPGIIDLHDHMHMTYGLFPQQAWQLLTNLAYGVTTARDPSTDYSSFGYAELLRTGQMIGPRLFSVGVAFTSDNFDLQSLNDARQLVQERKKMGAVAIKQYLQNTRLQKQWLLMASNEAGLNMTNEGEHFDPLNYFPMLKDGSTGIEHNDWDTWGNVYKDVVTLFSRSGTWLTPTLQVGTDDGFPYFANYYRNHPDQKLASFWPAEWQILFSKLPQPKDSTHLDFVNVSRIDADFRHHGMKVTMGSHGNFEGIGSQFELWALQMGGLTNMEALQSATIDGAEGLGMQHDLGSIEAGKIADLLVLDKNPLDDIHNTSAIKYVMKDGILYNGNTLDEIWPVEKKCPPAFRLKGAITDAGEKKLGFP